MKTIETDVLVVGGGPTGLTMGILLAREGLASHVIEKRDGPQRAPAAHVVNARTFEIWRQAGVDMEAILALAKNPRDAGHVHWVSRLGGEILGSLPFERQGEDVLDLTPTPLRNLSQHRLEPLLASQLAAVAGKGPHYSRRWESSRQDEGGVTSLVRDLASDEVYEVRSLCVVGADGAGSPVRKSLGIECVGPDRLQAFLMIHFRADFRSVVGDRPGVLFWISDPAAGGGIFVAHDIDREWVYMQPLDPDRESREDFHEARCEAVVRRAMAAGGEGIGIEIVTAAPWTMTSQVAERYRDGRVFLAGDAAHRFPPTGGLGLNTGVQDAHNLAWKLAAVARGWADEALLGTYESERRPVAAYNAEQSLANAMRLLEVPMAMGTADEPEAAARSFAAMLTDAGRRREVAAAIANQAEHFDMLGLQLGFSYSGPAFVDDGSSPAAPSNPVREFAPSARPGSRLPHGWIVAGGKTVSTLDLVRSGELTLLVPAASPWIPAAKAVDVPIRIVEWGRDVEDSGNWWAQTAGLVPGGALLVRPDQHVAARFAAAGSDATAVLASAVAAATLRRNS